MEKVTLRLLLTLFLIVSTSRVFAANDILSEAFRASYEAESAGELDQAIEKLVNIYDPGSYELNLRLGWLHYQKGNMDDSIIYYKRSIELMPYAIESRLGLALPWSAMAKWDDIITLYESILRIDPQNSLVNYRLGLIYYNRGQFERADPYIEKVVNLYPFDYDSLLLYAWNKLMLQRTREAKILFQKVLLANPGDESALRGLELIR